MFKEIRDALASNLEVSNTLDVNKLPKYAKDSVEFLRWDTPDEIQLMILNLKTCQMLSYNRIKFAWPDADIIWKPLMNLYWINFLESWWWKDKTLDSIDYYLMWFFKEAFKKNNELYLEAESVKVTKKALDLYWEKAIAQRQQYVRENWPRPFAKEIWDATAEWFELWRQQLQKAWFGSMFIRIDEMALYIKWMKSETVAFFRSLISSYEWNYIPKMIKSELKTVTTEWIPNNAIMYSSTRWLLSGQSRERLMEFLEIWFARRAFICYPDPIKKEVATNWAEHKKMKQLKKSNRVDPTTISRKLEYAFNNTKINRDISNWLFNEIVFYLKDEDAIDHYEMYKMHCKHVSEKYQDDIQRIEVRERFWRMLKLATLIASIEHPTVREISKKDLEYAIYQTEFFWKQAHKFFDDETSDVDILFKFIQENWPVNKTQIKDWLSISKNKFSEWFKKLQPELVDHCDDMWKTLKEANRKFFIKDKNHEFETDIDEIDKFIQDE